MYSVNEYTHLYCFVRFCRKMKKTINEKRDTRNVGIRITYETPSVVSTGIAQILLLIYIQPIYITTWHLHVFTMTLYESKKN